MYGKICWEHSVKHYEIQYFRCYSNMKRHKQEEKRWAGNANWMGDWCDKHTVMCVIRTMISGETWYVNHILWKIVKVLLRNWNLGAYRKQRGRMSGWKEDGGTHQISWNLEDIPSTMYKGKKGNKMCHL